ncbi:unnamed protein product [Closterium sp. NIES-64]|nr:unnamed protein product [Closterium sp. Naga37s-1]CAI5934750.1 unnamed protein product [Closterium sp. NIES-65]CAI5946080.1 unnamed protein product [Closterium sp. NIES-65]CAI5983202.1 unnamed protein product [Closterium sp. NIES-64]
MASIAASSAAPVIPRASAPRGARCAVSARLPRHGLASACPLQLRSTTSAWSRKPASAVSARPGVARAVVIESLPREFGLVVLTAAASAVLTQWQMIEVAKQRRASNVPYPKMYEDKEDSLFNCYQRAHQNTLESYPAFLSLLLIAGYAYPITASACGMVWVIGRVFYSLGYYTGNPRNRVQGMWGTFGLLGLLVTAGVFGVRQLL